jgi:hypothetical protein
LANTTKTTTETADDVTGKREVKEKKDVSEVLTGNKGEIVRQMLDNPANLTNFSSLLLSAEIKGRTDGDVVG